MNTDEIVAIIRTTLWVIDFPVPLDAEKVAKDVIDRLEWERIRVESDANPWFVRCQCCGNGNGACGCFCS